MASSSCSSNINDLIPDDVLAHIFEYCDTLPAQLGRFPDFLDCPRTLHIIIPWVCPLWRQICRECVTTRIHFDSNFLSKWEEMTRVNQLSFEAFLKSYGGGENDRRFWTLSGMRLSAFGAVMSDELLPAMLPFNLTSLEVYGRTNLLERVFNDVNTQCPSLTNLTLCTCATCGPLGEALPCLPCCSSRLSTETTAFDTCADIPEKYIDENGEVPCCISCDQCDGDVWTESSVAKYESCNLCGKWLCPDCEEMWEVRELDCECYATFCVRACFDCANEHTDQCERER